MTDLGPILERLGLETYLNAFVGEGFDTWETVLDIQESDLDALNVKLGHRRKLQREIANYRGISYDRLISSPAYEGSSEVVRSTEGAQTSVPASERGGPGGETKRKYRRHPKPDEHAPERPPSAYVIFSNKVREDVKADNLSFTSIAKLVGDRWQKLDPTGKEPYETQAAAAKERYTAELSAYKRTDEYKEYQAYLADFKAKHGPPQSESKRPKLDNTSSGGSLSARSVDTSESLVTTQPIGHTRVGSVGSVSSSSFVQTLPSPVGMPPGLTSTVSNPLFNSTGPRLTSASPQLVSPQGNFPQWETSSRPPVSSRSSVSEESSVTRSDYQDPLPRTAQLSLVSTPTGGAGFSAFASTDATTAMDPHRRSTRSLYHQQQEVSGQNISSALPSRFIPGSMPSMATQTASEEYWRARPPESASGIARNYPEFSRMLQPPSASGPKPLFGSIQLPPLISSERPLELSQDQSQRILPPPVSSPQAGYTSNLRSAPQTGSSPRIAGNEPGLPSSWVREETSTSLDSSESAAVNTLAGLATTADPRPGTAKPPRRGASPR